MRFYISYLICFARLTFRVELTSAQSGNKGSECVTFDRFLADSPVRCIKLFNFIKLSISFSVSFNTNVPHSEHTGGSNTGYRSEIFRHVYYLKRVMPLFSLLLLDKYIFYEKASRHSRRRDMYY